MMTAVKRNQTPPHHFGKIFSDEPEKDIVNMALPLSDAPPHQLQKMLIERLNVLREGILAEPPSLQQRANLFIELVSRFGGAFAFAASLALFAYWVF